VAPEVTYREATADDVPKTFSVFRAALWAYLLRTGYFSPEAPDAPPDAESWQRYQTVYEHLAACAARAWVAEDRDGRVIGVARSTEHDGIVELTEFFVRPDVQARGVGRELLNRAFPLGWGRHRTILATYDPRALALYFQFGVRSIATGIALVGPPNPEPVVTHLATERVGDDAATIRAMLAVERDVIGHARDADMAFFVRDRPAIVCRRGRDVVGYGFASGPGGIGPIAALDAADLPAVVNAVERLAFDLDPGKEILLQTAVANSRLVNHLLARGYRIDPFWFHILADEPFLDLDRYLITDPSFLL
jgi:GNAT superfamily N-acetyltransferase